MYRDYDINMKKKNKWTNRKKSSINQMNFKSYISGNLRASLQIIFWCGAQCFIT